MKEGREVFTVVTQKPYQLKYKGAGIRWRFTHTHWVGIHILQEAWKRTIEQHLTQLQQSVTGLQIS